MASPRFAWGIDIGNRGLKAVKLVRQDERLKVDDFEFIEHETILSQAGDNREQLMQTALANFVQRHTFKGGVVSVGVSGSSSFARFVKLPPVEEKKIPEIVRFEAIQQIPFPLEDVEWSYQLFRQPENPEVEVGIFAMRRELVNQHIKFFTDFDLNVQTVQMNPLAVYNALQYDGRLTDASQGVTMVVDVGSENTDLLICSNDSIWMRSIPIGGNNFTESLVKAFKLTFAKAEDLKRNAATSKYARQIFQAMRPIFADLVAEIQRSIGFYSSVHRESRLTRIVALGGTFRLPGLQKYLQQNLQLEVEKIDSLTAGAPDDPKLASSFDENLLSIVGAYGLAVQAMGDGVVTSSLLPRAIQKERIWQEKTKWFATAAALMLAVPTIAGARYFYENLRWDNNAPLRAEVDKTKREADAQDKKWNAIQGSGGDEKARIANVNSINDLKTVWRDLLLELSNAVPQPTGALATALSSNDKAAITAVPRGERKYLQIDSIQSRYVSNLESISKGKPPEAWAGAGGERTAPMGGLGTAAQSADTAPAVDVSNGAGRGYVLTLRMTTPYQDIVPLQTELEAALKKIAPSADRRAMKFAITEVAVVDVKRIDSDPARKTRLTNEYNTLRRGAELPADGTGLTPGGLQPTGVLTDETPAPAVNSGGFDFGNEEPEAAPTIAPTGDPAFADPVTGESVLNDWEFVVAVAVVLDPAPFEPGATPAAPAEGTAAAN